MSSDTFHHQNEKSMRDVKSVYEFPDLEKIVHKKRIAICLTESDFYQHENGKSQAKHAEKKPHLNEMQCVRFENETKNN